MEKDRIAVSIAQSLYKRIEEEIKNTGDESIEAYINKVLNEKLAGEKSDSDELSDEDEEKVKERLKALGYMD